MQTPNHDKFFIVYQCLGQRCTSSGGILGAVNLAKVGGVWGRLSAGSDGGSDEIVGEFAASKGVNTCSS